MSVFTVKPLDDRSGFTGKSKPSAFKRSGSGDQWWRREPVPFSETRALLGRELRQVGASNVILEVDVLPGQIRLDGELYANAKVKSPAVRLHFDSKHGHLTYQTDVFTTWQDNVRAIARGLEALRKVDRYGIGRGDEQYRGYLALEAGTGGIALGGITRDQALSILGDANGIPGEHLNTDPHSLRSSWRRARKLAHPDRHDGDQTEWDKVEQAAKVLGL